MTAPVTIGTPVDTSLVVVPGQVQPRTNPALIGLAPPLLSEAEPSDMLGMLMALMERMASQGVKESSQSIQANQDKLQAALEKFQAKMEEIARKAEEAKKKDDGWGFLGDICSAVCDFVGDVWGECFGNLADFSVDLVRGNVDIIVGLVKGQNLEALLTQELKDLGSKGKLGDTVDGAVRGVTDFHRDLLNAYSGTLEAIANGKPVSEALKEFGELAWNCFVDNIIENEDVMQVLGTALKVVAIGTAVASGGALGMVAVGLFALSMVDQHTGLCKEVFGDEAGPWVSLGINVAAAVCLGFAAGGDGSLLGEVDGMEWLNDVDVQHLSQQLRAVSSIVSGAVSVGQGARLLQVGVQRREEARDSADLMKIMNLMASIQRTIDSLISEAEERTENRGRIREGAADVYRLEGQSFELAASSIRA